MSELTLLGTIPGLLRRGSPVISRDEYGVFLYDGVVCGTDDGGLVVANDNARWPADLSDVALDLTDATGRAHAAWWLCGATSGVWSPQTKGVWRVTWLDPHGSGMRLSRVFPGADDLRYLDLDPNDSRLLPDGSRWVDAEALRRVCLHVAGVPHD